MTPHAVYLLSSLWQKKSSSAEGYEWLKAQYKTPPLICAGWEMGFMSKGLKSWGQSQEVKQQLTLPCSPLQNGVAKCISWALAELRGCLGDLWLPIQLPTAFLMGLLLTQYDPPSIRYICRLIAFHFLYLPDRSEVANSTSKCFLNGATCAAILPVSPISVH